MPVTIRAVSGYPPHLVPNHTLKLGFDDCLEFSTPHLRFTQRSPYQFTPDGFQPAFSRNAHHPDHWPAAWGGLDADPAARVRGACPHSSLVQIQLRQAAIAASFRARGAQCTNKKKGA